MNSFKKPKTKQTFFVFPLLGVSFLSLVSCSSTETASLATTSLTQKQESAWRDTAVVEVLKQRLKKAEEQAAKDLVPLADQLYNFAEGLQKTKTEAAAVARKSNKVIASLLFKGTASTHDPVFNFASLNEYEQPVHSYLLAQEKLSQFEIELKELEKEKAEVHLYQNSLLKVKQLFEKALLLQRQLLMLAHQLLVKQKKQELAEDALEAAKNNNWSYGSELALYLLGFKWLWGFFTMYSPTRFTSRQAADLAKASQELDQTKALVLEKKQQILPLLRRTLNQFYQSLRVARTQTKVFREQRGLLNLEVSALKVFEDLEVFAGYNWLEWLRARYTERLGAKRLDYEASRWVYNLDGFSWAPFKTNTTSQLNLFAEEIQPHMAYRDLLAFQFKKSYWFYWFGKGGSDPEYLIKGIPATILPPLWNVATASPLRPHYQFIEHSSAGGAFNWKRQRYREWVTHLGWEPGAKYLEAAEAPYELFEALFASPTQRLLALEAKKQSLLESRAFAREYLAKLKKENGAHKFNRVNQTVFLKKALKDAARLSGKLKLYLTSLTKDEEPNSQLYEALREALLSVVTSVELHKNKLVLQESLLLLKELVQLREQTLNTAYLANWSIPSEIVLYLFGFKWFWGAFTGYQATPLVSTEKNQFRQTKEFAERAQVAVAKKLEELNTEFQASFTKTREALFKAGRLASGEQKSAIQRFASHYKVVFQEQEFAKEKYEQAKEIFNAYRIHSGQPYSQASRIDGYFSVPGFMANFFTMGMFGQRSQHEEQKKMLEEATSETRYQVLEYKQAAEDLRAAQQKYEAFFDPQQGLKEIFEVLEGLKEQEETTEKIKRTALIASEVQSNIKQRLEGVVSQTQEDLTEFWEEFKAEEEQQVFSQAELTAFLNQFGQTPAGKSEETKPEATLEQNLEAEEKEKKPEEGEGKEEQRVTPAQEEANQEGLGKEEEQAGGGEEEGPSQQPEPSETEPNLEGEDSSASQREEGEEIKEGKPEVEGGLREETEEAPVETIAEKEEEQEQEEAEESKPEQSEEPGSQELPEPSTDLEEEEAVEEGSSEAKEVEGGSEDSSSEFAKENQEKEQEGEVTEEESQPTQDTNTEEAEEAEEEEEDQGEVDSQQPQEEEAQDSSGEETQEEE